jgi:integrase
MATQANRLTDTRVRNLQAKDRQYKFADGNGLFIHVLPTGTKSWRLRYFLDGQEKSVTLGIYPELGLADARRQRQARQATINQGIDPVQERRRNQAKEQADIAVTRAQRQVAQNTFEVIGSEWLESIGRGQAATTRLRRRRNLHEYLYPAIGTLPITEIKAGQIKAVLDKLTQDGLGETVRRVQQDCSKVFCYAVATDRAQQDPASPLQGLHRQPKVKHRPAVTSKAELAPILQRLHSFEGHPITVAVLKVLPLLFVRPGELRAMRWEHIDFEAKQWKFTTGKTNQDHIVPLANQVIEVLQALRPFTDKSRYVFPLQNNNQNPMQENTFIKAFRAVGIDPKVQSAHGFRATARTMLNEVLLEPVDIIEHQLAHKVRGPLGRAYNRATHIEHRTLMMQGWADYLDGLRTGSNVVQLPRVRANA